MRLYPVDHVIDKVAIKGSHKGNLRKAYVETRQTTKGLPWTIEVLVLETK